MRMRILYGFDTLYSFPDPFEAKYCLDKCKGHGNEKRRAGDIFMKFGKLGLFLTRNRMKIFSGPKNDTLVVKSRVIWSKINYGRKAHRWKALREFTYVKITKF